MFGFNKRKPQMFVEWDSIYWRTDMEYVDFEDFVTMVLEYDLKIVDQKLRVIKNYEGISYTFLEFGLEGTLTQLALFRQACLTDYRGEYYRKIGEGF